MSNNNPAQTDGKSGHSKPGHSVIRKAVVDSGLSERLSAVSDSSRDFQSPLVSVRDERSHES
jgi:hypothetical protein